jgi:PAS domain S-box-containing protein
VAGFWPFFGLSCAAALWAIPNTFEKLSFNLEDKIFWAKLQYPGIVAIGVLWLLFSIEYTQQQRILNRVGRNMLWIIPFIGVLLSWTNEYHHLIWTEISLLPAPHGMGAIFRHGPAFFALWVYIYILLIAGVIVLVSRLRRQAAIYQRQYLIIMGGILVPWVVNFLYVIGYSPIPGMDLTPQSMVVACIMVAWSIWRFQMLDLIPVGREAVLDRMADGVLIVDMRQNVIEINPRAEQILNLKRSQVVGKPVRQALQRWPNLIDPCCPDEEIVLELFPNSGPAITNDNQLTRPSRRYELRSTPLLDDHSDPLGYILLLRDITERMRSEERLRLQSVALESAANGIVITDINGVIEWVNPAFIRMTGYSLEDVIGQNPRILKSNTHDNHFYEEMWQMILSGQPWHGEIINKRKDGRFYTEEMTIAPVRTNSGEISNFVAIKQDISARKRAEAALMQSNAEKQRLQEAEAILQERNRIAQEIHDGLAQNLAALRMRIGRWRRVIDQDPARLQAELDEAEEIVAASLQEARRSIFALRPLALKTRGFSGALQQFISGFGEYYDLKVHLQMQPLDETGLFNRITELTLFRIIQEGLNNVAKHAHAQNAWINLNKNELENIIDLTIRDDGRGFDPEVLDDTEKNGHFGLHAMQERVQSAGGKWAIHSRPGQGVCLEIRLPIRNNPKEG